MKVHALTISYRYAEDDYLLGVFSTLEKAKHYAESRPGEALEWTRLSHWGEGYTQARSTNGDYFYIEEQPLDPEWSADENQ